MKIDKLIEKYKGEKHCMEITAHQIPVKDMMSDNFGNEEPVARQDKKGELYLVKNTKISGIRIVLFSEHIKQNEKSGN